MRNKLYPTRKGETIRFRLNSTKRWMRNSTIQNNDEFVVESFFILYWNKFSENFKTLNSLLKVYNSKKILDSLTTIMEDGGEYKSKNYPIIAIKTLDGNGYGNGYFNISDIISLNKIRKQKINSIIKN